MIKPEEVRKGLEKTNGSLLRQLGTLLHVLEVNSATAQTTVTGQTDPVYGQVEVTTALYKGAYANSSGLIAGSVHEAVLRVLAKKAFDDGWTNVHFFLMQDLRSQGINVDDESISIKGILLTQKKLPKGTRAMIPKVVSGEIHSFSVFHSDNPAEGTVVAKKDNIDLNKNLLQQIRGNGTTGQRFYTSTAELKAFFESANSGLNATATDEARAMARLGSTKPSKDSRVNVTGSSNAGGQGLNVNR